MSRTDPNSFDATTSPSTTSKPSGVSLPSYPVQPPANSTSPPTKPVTSATSASTSSSQNIASTGDNSTKWKWATALLCVTIIVTTIGWITYSKKLNSARKEVSFYSSSASSESEKVRDLALANETLSKELQAEKEKRARIAEAWPLTITEIKLRNENGSQSFGSFSDRFNEYDVRYIQWYATLKNNFVGVKTLSGDLYVKYIKPDGTLDYNASISPSGYTHRKTINVYDTTEESMGWGSERESTYRTGTYRIQFWWNGRIIGEKSFTVY